MKKLLYIIAATGVLLSCKKENVDTPQLTITTDKTEYKAGETVTFKMSGDAGIISFYSGEKGKEYAFKDRTEVADGKLGLSIETQVLYGNQDNIKLLYSNDFNGLFDTTSVRAANWTDISSRFTWSAAASGAVGNRVISALADISDVPASGKPVYFAFKYAGAKVTSGTTTTQRTWRVYGFDLSNTLTDGTVLSVTTAATAGWIGLDFVNTVNKWTIQSTAPYVYFSPASTLLPSEDWVISKALFPKNVSPALGTGIKTLINPMTDYSYIFNAAGTYTCTFVATNATNEGEKQIVIQKEIKILP